MHRIRDLIKLPVLLSLFLLLFFSCQPLATQFDEIEDGTLYTANSITTPPDAVNQIKVMTWNIRFGAGRIPWFGDSCGERVILSKDEVYASLEALADKINEIEPDILLLQEVDINSKRSGYINQLQWLLDSTYLNYGALGTSWQAQYIPSDGLGRMHAGNAILSRWPIADAVRIQLPRRGDQDGLTSYFYIQHNMLKTKIALPGLDNFYVCNIHLAAFSTDDTKKKQVDRVKEELDRLSANGAYLIAGGDFNLLPPGSDSTDYCLEDICPGESFHKPGDDPFHKEGSNYTPEMSWMQNLYSTYTPAVEINNYTANQLKYFTHTTQFKAPPDRKLDYLFTNYNWEAESDSTYLNLINISDHVPVSAAWEIPE